MFRQQFFHTFFTIFAKFFPLFSGLKENKRFYKNISWSFFGGIISGGVLFVTYVIAGRLLGPNEFGKVNSIIIVAQLLFPLFLFGSDTAVARELSKMRDDVRQSDFISSAVILGVVMIGFFSTCILLCSQYIFSFVSISHEILVFFIITIILFSLKYLLEGCARGLKLYKKQSYFRIFESIIIIVLFFLFYSYFHITTFHSLIMAYICGSIFLIFAYLYSVKSFVHYKNMKVKIGIRILRYGKFVVISLLLTSIFLVGDRIIISKYLGDYALGLYAAHYTVSMLLLGLISVIIGNVFFVYISHSNNKKNVAKKVNIIFRKIFVIAYIMMYGVVYVGMLLFGGAYETNHLLIALFTLLSVLYFFSTIYTLIIMSHSHKLYALLIMSLIMRASVFLLYIMCLVQGNSISIEYILLGLIVNFGLDIIIARTIIYKFL